MHIHSRLFIWLKASKDLLLWPTWIPGGTHMNSAHSSIQNFTISTHINWPCDSCYFNVSQLFSAFEDEFFHPLAWSGGMWPVFSSLPVVFVWLLVPSCWWLYLSYCGGRGPRGSKLPFSFESGGEFVLLPDQQKAVVTRHSDTAYGAGVGDWGAAEVAVTRFPHGNSAWIGRVPYSRVSQA